VSRGRITVVGLDGRPLDEEIARLLADAALVAGGGRHLEMLGVESDRALVLEGDLSEALARIEGKTCVSGQGSPPSRWRSPAPGSPGTTRSR
jgi:hypothetical protein